MALAFLRPTTFYIKKAEPLPVTQTEEKVRERERWEVAIVVVLVDMGTEKVSSSLLS